MITPIIKENRVIFGPVRLSYTHLFEKWAPKDSASKPQYMTNVLIPKKEKETIAAIKQAIEASKRDSIVSKWGGKAPKNLAMPLRDGDEKEDGDELYADHYYMNAKADKRPGIVDRNKEPITDEEEIYSGVWAIVSITFYGYENSGNRGIGCGINNVMKYKDDEQLGGRISAAAEFADVNMDDDEDDL